MGSKIQHVRLNYFRAGGSILMGLFSFDAPRSRCDKMGTIFTMPAPKNLWRQKNPAKFFAIFDNFRLWSRISPERINISKIGKALDHLQPLPRYAKKNLIYFGPQTKKLLTLINVHPNWLFSGDYISALRGWCAMKFLYALQIDQGYLAHTPPETGVPPKKFNSES